MENQGKPYLYNSYYLCFRDLNFPKISNITYCKPQIALNCMSKKYTIKKAGTLLPRLLYPFYSKRIY